MRTHHTLAALAGVLALGACTMPPPTAPTVLATPPSGKDLTRFQNEDMSCRQYAMGQSGDPSQAAGNAAVGSAAIGTGLGAAAGALIGSAGGAMGAGAAVGAGMGLLAGSAIGANQARAAGYSAQQIFDMAYSQCMTSQGNQIQGPVAPAYAPAYGYAAPYPYYAAPYPYYYPGPAVVVGPRWGWGWGYRRW